MTGAGDLSAAISRLGPDRARWLIALDFDGTLAPIVPRPEDARLDPALAPLLARLSATVGCVAVISGRPREFLEAQVGSIVPITLGSYGLEMPPELSRSGSPARFDPDAAADHLRSARTTLERLLPAGGRLEVKPFGLVLHHRGAGPEFDEAGATKLMSRVAADNDLDLVPGRMVLELKPHHAVDKGWALGMLAARVEASAIVYVGDDLGDVPAWEATRQLGERIPTLAVGIASDELPAEALANCDLVLPDRGGLAALLTALSGRAEEPARESA